MAFDIRPFDPKTAEDSEWELFNRGLNSRSSEIFPEDPPVALEVQRKLWSVDIPKGRRFFWLALDPDQNLGGFAFCELEDTPENEHASFGDIYVLPNHRRCGLGSQLLACLVELSISNQRRTMVGEITYPSSAESQSSPGAAFTRRVGGEAGLEAHQLQLDLAQMDHGLLLDWQARAASQHAAGGSGEFEIVFLGLPYPEEELERICKMFEAGDDEPHGTLDVVHTKLSPDLLRRFDAVQIQRGVERWTMAVRHVPSGVFAGYTQVNFVPSRPQVVSQSGTAIHKVFRNRGLGRWLKAEMALKILAERPHIRYVRSTNADVNAPMIKINDEMGFKAHHINNIVQAPVEALAKYARERQV